jgi:hypothetical protein
VVILMPVMVLIAGVGSSMLRHGDAEYNAAPNSLAFR